MGNNIIHGSLKLISAVQKLRCCSSGPSHNRKNLCKTHSKSISHAKLPFLSSLSLSSNQKMQCIGTHLDIHEILHATNEFKTVRVRLHKGHSGGTVQQGHSFFLVALLPSGNHGILFPNPFLYSYPSAGSLGLATWL